MAANVYEGLFILDPTKYSADPVGVSGQLGTMVEKHGGTVLASRLWEERRLAYPINGRRMGTYWLTYFRLDSAKVPQVERDTQLNESVLRSLVIKIEPRIAEAIVTHALTSTPSTARPAPGGPRTSGPRHDDSGDRGDRGDRR